MSDDPQMIPPTASVSAPGAGPHAEPDDKEEIYFEGSPPMRAFAGKVFGFILIAVVLIAIAVLLIHQKIGPWWIAAILIGLAFAVQIIPWMDSRRVRYRITNYRIDYERGLLGKNIDTMELWHVEDLHFHQTFANRILNVGTITVLSKDESMPQLSIFGIPNPRPIYEMLKQRVIAVKRQRGVIKMDPG
jgi:membrane protein YdbS with pleckstrin-like domain